MLPRVAATIRTPAVIALLGDAGKIFPSGRAPQGTSPPYVTWFVVSGQPFDQISGAPPSDRATVQIDCYAGPSDAAELTVVKLATAVRAALDAAGIANSLIINTREPETEFFRIGQQADFITDR